MQSLWFAFLGAELLVPSSVLLPLVATAVHAVFASEFTASRSPIGFLIVSAIVLLVMIAFQKLLLFLACWWAMIFGCPQRAMRECIVGLFAHQPMTPPPTDTFPTWWQRTHIGFLLTGLLLMACSGETYNPKLFVGDWSWTGLFLCKGSCCLIVPSSVNLAMDFKESPDALALLITAPARWPKTSIVGFLISIILMFSLPVELKTQWVVKYGLPVVGPFFVEEQDVMKWLNSAIFGLSFFGAWLFPWMAAFVAGLQRVGEENHGELLEFFFDQLMPIDANITPLPRCQYHSLDALQGGRISRETGVTRVPPSPPGHIVVEATNLIAARRGRTDTLIDLLTPQHPTMTMEGVLGPRGYARVKIAMENEDVVKTTIKDIARARGVRTTVKVVERVFYSPRD